MNSLSARLVSALELIIVCLLFGGAVLAQVRFDAIQQEHFDLRAPVHRFAMPAPIVRYFAFGFDNVLADYYWITAIQDFNKWDRRDFYYPEYFRIISTLDPHFAYPYMFAVLTVPSRQNPDSLRWLSLIVSVGMKALPDNWQIPFYAGVQFHVVGKSYEEATRYLEIAGAKPSSPDMVRAMHGVYLMHNQSEYQRSRALFLTIAETTDHEATKELAKERVALLDLMEEFKKAALSYKAKYHRFPVSIDEMAAAHFVQAPPDILKKFPMSIDQATGEVTLLR